MDLLKNMTVINLVYILLGILLILVGVYRENVYRDKDEKQKNRIIELQQKQIELQQRIDSNQISLQNTIDHLVKTGEMTKETANKILKIDLKDNVSVEDSVEMKLRPSGKSPNISLKDNIEIKRVPSDKSTVKEEINKNK